MDERRIQELEARVAALEQAVAAMRQGEAPRPVYVPPKIMPPPVVGYAASSPARPTDPQPAPRPAARKNQDTEYLIGAKVIPFVAAVILLLGIGYLVSLGLSNGWITPSMLFGGACALCGAFIVLGQVKREEKEEFGHILTGIGSCGLYLTFAAGHIFQHLYSGETLVALFLVLSFLNLGYSLWRSSRAFLAIGMMGGFAAALMPLQNLNVPLNIGLHFLVIAPCAFIAGRRRWPQMAAILWLVATLALMPAWGGDFDWRWRITALGFSSLIAVAAYELARDQRSNDWKDGVGPFSLGLTALANFLSHPHMEGALHTALFSGATAILALALGSRRPGRNHLLGAALTIAATILPWGFPPAETVYLFAGLATVGGLLAGHKRWPLVAVLASVELALGIAAYGVALGMPFTNLSRIQLDQWAETGALAALIAGAVAAAYGSVRARGPAQVSVLAAAVVTLPMFLRVAALWLGSGGAGLDPFFAVALGALLFSTVSLGLLLMTRWRSADDFLWAVLLIGLVVYGVAAATSTTGITVDLIALVAYIGMISAAATATVRVGNDRRMTVVAAGLLVGALTSRIAVVLLASKLVGWPSATAISLGACVFAAIVAGVVSSKRLPDLLIPGAVYWTVGALALAIHGVEVGDRGMAGQMALCVGLVGVLVWLTTLSTSESKDKRLPMVVASMAGWAVFSRLGYLALGPSGVGMQQQPSLSVTWTIFGFALLAIGFVAHQSALRYSSFAVLGATVGKVLLIDLAGTEPAIRVLVLMALGSALLGGGYWYIRSRQALAP